MKTTNYDNREFTIAWYSALIEGRIASAQYLEPDFVLPGNDANCGKERDSTIISGVIE
jgi:hypothetical protein